MSNNETKSFTAIHRVLHWVGALLMGGLFITGFLRLKWMGRDAITKAAEAGAQGAALTKQQLSGISRGVLHPMWEWHVYAAYIMFFIIAARIVHMLARGIKFPSPFAKGSPLKERFQGVVYMVFYIFAGMSAITGAYLKWGGNRSIESVMQKIHLWGLYWFPVFILLHFAGIVIGEHTTKRGITSRMVGGDR